MNPNRPTQDELRALFPCLSNDTFHLAVNVLHNPDSTLTLLRLALLEWMGQEQILGESSRLLVLLTVVDDLEVFAARYDVAEQQDEDEYDAHEVKRPQAALVVSNSRYVTVAGPDPTKPPRFYDLVKKDWTSGLPQEMLTTISCDLSVLMLQTLRGLKWHREQREKTKPAIPWAEGRDKREDVHVDAAVAGEGPARDSEGADRP